MENNYVIKFLYGSGIHRFTLDKSASLSEIQEMIKNQLKLAVPIYLTYFDKENDEISVANDQDLAECFRFYKSQSQVNSSTEQQHSQEKESAQKSSQQQQPVTIRFHVSTQPYGTVWPDNCLQEWKDKLPSREQIRDFTVNGFHALEKALNDFAFKAEETVLCAAESSKRIFNQISHRLSSSSDQHQDSPTSSSATTTGTASLADDASHQMSVTLVSPSPREVISIPSNSSQTVTLVLKNAGSTPLPSDTILELNTATNAVFIQDEKSIRLVNRDSQNSSKEFGVIPLQPNGQISVPVKIVSSPDIKMGQFQGFWKISSKSFSASETIPIQWHITPKDQNVNRKMEDEFVELKKI